MVAVAVASFLDAQDRASRSMKTVEMEQWRATVICSGLGNLAIGKLTVLDCDRFLALAAAGEFGSRPIGPEALGRIRRLLIRVLNNEVRTGNLNRNVADLSIMPAIGKAYDDIDDDDGDSSSSVRRTLTHDEYRLLWRTAQQPLVVAVDLCGRNGLRPSEARGLRWERVDFEAETMTIDRQMSSSSKLTKVKTRRSLRTIPMDDITADCLGAWRDEQVLARGRAGDRWTETPALVITTRYGTAIDRKNLIRMLAAACKEADIKRIVPYELRHTAITFQRTSGKDAWQVADWAGTSERMVEEIYRHRLGRVAPLGPVQVEGLGPILGPNP